MVSPVIKINFFIPILRISTGGIKIKQEIGKFVADCISTMSLLLKFHRNYEIIVCKFCMLISLAQPT